MMPLLVVLLLVPVLCKDNYFHYTDSADYFTNEWVVRVKGGPDTAKSLASELGYVFKGPIRGFPETYLIVKPGDGKEVYKRGPHYKTKEELIEDNRVVWADQQSVRQRQKRDLVIPYAGLPWMRGQNLFNDELWPHQWYLQDTRVECHIPKLDLNVIPVYKMGFTGRGVRVSILDDGLEYTHEDLKDNYDPLISWDCNEDDWDPMPRYDGGHTNAHGTRCAGEVAMVANNGKCGVGVAFNAKIGGIKLLDGVMNDLVEGTALSFAQDLVDIYSASWGPNDDGRTVDGPGRLALEAFRRGVTEGRNGRGIIFIWASGNGGSNGDNCDCDGYTGSPYTVSVGSASQHGAFPWYGEPCASTLAVTYSSGAYLDQKITTTDLRNRCTIKHTGTSASAPLAAGIIALALEANPSLTWRDVQHLIVWTSDYAPVADNRGWQRNAAGLWINTRFGFGLMNAHQLVTAALNWTTVPTKSICYLQNVHLANRTIEHGQIAQIFFVTDACFGTNREIKYLEHVEVKVNIDYTTRGALSIYLYSAAGTKLQLLSPRKLDTSYKGFRNWKFLSVLTWGENPEGIWTLEIMDKVGDPRNFGRLGMFKLILHGTKIRPAHMHRKM